MINSPLIEGGIVARPPPFYEYVSGERPDQASAPEQVAWKLENAACALGWPAGRIMGSEAELLRGFGVGRETLRAAIRIVERRGAMRMTRGRFGGLTIARPSLQQAAMALAIYLRALGCPVERVDELIGVLRTMAHDDATLPLRLAEGAGEMLRALDAKDGSPGCRAMFANPNVRAAMIAMRIIDASETGVDPGRLGCEWDLSIRFATSRLVMRQALRVLRDFDMLETRRGRGGGVFLKRPAPIAIVRQLFSYLASEGHTVETSLEKLWILNLANLQLASTRLARMPASDRERWIARTGTALEELEEPQRWVVLQQALASLSDNVLLDTLARCMACFQARQGLPVPRQPSEIVETLLTHERDILSALCLGRSDAAEAAHDAAQALMGWLVRAAGATTPETITSPDQR
ncbi:hypothetical protein [Sphingomonas sp. MMS24-J13]|uniref:hypothetical protein n=1 Tax=Sphingomonas sp. MMS24-J13 TaxID=3238686 RepID=UPI00384B4922